eukprot:2304018-Amphidinium_carterae.1
MTTTQQECKTCTWTTQATATEATTWSSEALRDHKPPHVLPQRFDAHVLALAWIKGVSDWDNHSQWSRHIYSGALVGFKITQLTSCKNSQSAITSELAHRVAVGSFSLVALSRFPKRGIAFVRDQPMYGHIGFAKRHLQETAMTYLPSSTEVNVMFVKQNSVQDLHGWNSGRTRAIADFIAEQLQCCVM